MKNLRCSLFAPRWALPLIAAAAFAQRPAAFVGLIGDPGGKTSVEGVAVVASRPDGTQSRTRIDATGVFRFGAVPPGDYTLAFEWNGFLAFRTASVGESTTPAAVGYNFSPLGKLDASLAGSVEDAGGRAAAGAAVDLIAGPSLHFRTTTDERGRFRFAAVPRGEYLLRAAPRQRRRSTDAPTYYPGSPTQSGAQRINVGGAAEISGFQLASAPSYPVAGVVRSANGTPVAGAPVRLRSVVDRPAHIAASFDNYLMVAPEGPAASPNEASATSGSDGTFEFPSVGAGRWLLEAESPDGALSGSTRIEVQRAEVRDVAVRVEPDTTARGSLRFATICVSGRLGCGWTAYEGLLFPMWARSADSGDGRLAMGSVRGESIEVAGIRAGESSLTALPPLLGERVLYGAAPTPSQPAWLSGLRPLSLNIAFRLSEGGQVLLDPNPRAGVLLSGVRSLMSATIAGSVEGTQASAAAQRAADVVVVLLPERTPQGPSYGAYAVCDSEGKFAMQGLLPGKYRAAAFRGLEPVNLRDERLVPEVEKVGVSVRLESVRANGDVRLTVATLR